MHRLPTDRMILALTYTDTDHAAAALNRLWRSLVAAGCVCAGIIQRDQPSQAGKSRCDMILESLSTGQHVKVSEDRGEHARGCRLDVGELMRALEIERQRLSTNPDVVIVNKFGKTESEGGGLRPLVADAIEHAIPVLITVPWRNIESWRLFAGNLAIERPAETLLREDGAATLAQIGLLLPTDAAPTDPPATAARPSSPAPIRTREPGCPAARRPS